MKIIPPKPLTLFTGLLILGTQPVGSAESKLIVDTIVPTQGVHISQSSFSKNVTFSAKNSSQMGQTFTTGDSGFSLTEIAMIKGTTQNYNLGNSLKLHIFSWSPSGDANSMAEWVKGDGSVDHDPTNGTGMTVLDTVEIFELGSSVSEGDIMHFRLSTPLKLAANTAYGFTFEFVFGAGSGAHNLNFKQDIAGNKYSKGQKISANATQNSGGDHADLAFYLIAGNSLPLSTVVQAKPPEQPATVVAQKQIEKPTLSTVQNTRTSALIGIGEVTLMLKNR